MTRSNHNGLVPTIGFVVVFVGVIYFMCFKLLAEMDPPAFFAVAFLGVATFMLIMVSRAAEPKAWTIGGIVVGAVLALPIALQALFG